MVKQLSSVDKQQIIQLHVRGFNHSLISRQKKCNRKTVSLLINNWKRGKLVNKIQRRKPHYKLSALKVYRILNYFIENPFHTYRDCIRDLKLIVSPMTIARGLSQEGRRNKVACSKPFLSMQNQIKRLKFAIKYKNWTSLEWMQVFSLHEKTIQTYANGKVQVKRKINERYDPDQITTTEQQNTKIKLILLEWFHVMAQT